VAVRQEVPRFGKLPDAAIEECDPGLVGLEEWYFGRRPGASLHGFHTAPTIPVGGSPWFRVYPKPLVKQLRSHDTRVTWASLSVQSGTDVVAVQRTLGHRDLKTTTDALSSRVTALWARAELDSSPAKGRRAVCGRSTGQREPKGLAS